MQLKSIIKTYWVLLQKSENNTFVVYRTCVTEEEAIYYLNKKHNLYGPYKIKSREYYFYEE